VTLGDKQPTRLQSKREGGRADEGDGLENRWRGDPSVGSNPTPPAIYQAVFGRGRVERWPLTFAIRYRVLAADQADPA
jgi:hypothetical protein